MSGSGALAGVLSPNAESVLRWLNDLAADNPPEMRALALEVVQSLSAKELALIIAWRDGCRGMEPEHGALSVTFAGDVISSEFTRKSRLTIVAGKKKQR